MRNDTILCGGKQNTVDKQNNKTQVR